ncbi:MAG: hypothetical protein ABI196_14055 [Bradyrhizobium sp.]
MPFRFEIANSVEAVQDARFGKLAGDLSKLAKANVNALAGYLWQRNLGHQLLTIGPSSCAVNL